MLLRHGGVMIIAETKAGNFKLYMQGQADGHIMDWAGCNFKYMTVSAQPHRGFEKFSQAEALLKWYRSNYKFYQFEEDRARNVGGSYISEDRIY